MFDATFVADQMSVRQALADIRAAMEQHGCDADLTGRIETVLAELFNNIAEHAYQGTGAGQVQCRLRMQATQLIAEIRDQGAVMPGGNLPEGALPDLDVDLADLPEGGFGWFIIRSQTDGLSYERQGNDNCTCLTFDASQR